ncbi:hypothetical protein FHT98_0656 [Bosea sp. AK1]|uniref:hypothetical protein n=1 Tax=Bosea sp. AK1 TaxID=2587160 RepID=UPI001153A3C1|nr:hypothetical protein [Bosea sp. AK1]TQI72936.1 hypothetical protein FHT98_0656 [Bosea sp. AK1]
MSAVPKLYTSHWAQSLANPPLAAVLCASEAARALELFRRHLDNVQIASRIGCTPAAAANGIARARDEERRAVA